MWRRRSSLVQLQTSLAAAFLLVVLAVLFLLVFSGAQVRPDSGLVPTGRPLPPVVAPGVAVVGQGR